MSIKWHREGYSVINEENKCIAVCLTEAVAEFIVNLSNQYWEEAKKNEREYIERDRLGL